MKEHVETELAHDRRGAGAGIALAVIAGLLGVGTVLVTVPDTPPGARAGVLTLHLSAILFAVGLGLYRLRRDRGDRFARALIAVGLASSSVALAQSDDPTLYSIGRTAVWVLEPAIVFLIL